MRLTLGPDPGTGRHWRLFLEVAGFELYCDLERREDGAAALRKAWGVAKALCLSEVAEGEWLEHDHSRLLAMQAWFCARGATGAGEWPDDPDNFAKQINTRAEFDAWWSGR